MLLLGQILQELISAPPPQADPTHSVGMDPVAEEMESEVEIESEVQCHDVGVQVAPRKKNARFQARPRCFSVG